MRILAGIFLALALFLGVLALLLGIIADEEAGRFFVWLSALFALNFIAVKGALLWRSADQTAQKIPVAAEPTQSDALALCADKQLLPEPTVAAAGSPEGARVQCSPNLRRRVSGTVLACLLAVLAFYGLNRDFVDCHLDWLRLGGAEANFEFDILADVSTEADLRARLPQVGLRCIDDRTTPLGDRVCYVRLQSFHGIPALVAAFFFKGGQLQHAKVDVPNWHHEAAASWMKHRFGRPSGWQDKPHSGVRLVGWQLHGGAVYLNIERSWNPVIWSSIYWKNQSPEFDS